MSVKIHGKEYRTVAERVNLFHDENKDAVKSIRTKILFNQADKVVMKATITVGDGVYTGHAEETYGSSMINETSALENCETSAIGRALASEGLGGSEFASADEVANAIANQSPKKARTNGLAWSEKSREENCMMGKHKGEPWSEIPTDYLEWLANKSSLGDELKLFATTELVHRAGEKNRDEQIEREDADNKKTIDANFVSPHAPGDENDNVSNPIVADDRELKSVSEEVTAVLSGKQDGLVEDKEVLAKNILDIAEKMGLDNFKRFKTERIGRRKFIECSTQELNKLLEDLRDKVDLGLPF